MSKSVFNLFVRYYIIIHLNNVTIYATRCRIMKIQGLTSELLSLLATRKYLLTRLTVQIFVKLNENNFRVKGR